MGSFSCMRVYHSKEFEESSTVLKSLGKFSLNLSVKRFQVFFFIEGSVLFFFFFLTNKRSMSNLGYLCSFSRCMYTVKYRVMEKYFSRMYSKFLVMRLCSHLIITLIEKKGNVHGLGRHIFEKYVLTPPIIIWVSSSVAPFTLHCRKMFNNS